MKKYILLLVLSLMSLISLAQFKISSQGTSRVFVIENISEGFESEYSHPGADIFGYIGSNGNIHIVRNDKFTPKGDKEPIPLSGRDGIPYTRFVDENEDAFASANAVISWFRNNTSFKSAGGSALTTALEAKLEKGTYTGTAEDLKSELDAVTSGYQGKLAIADTPTEDGYYTATESGTYTNAGSLVVDLSLGATTIIKSGATHTKVVVPMFVNGEVALGDTSAVSGDTVYEANKESLSGVLVYPSMLYTSDDLISGQKVRSNTGQVVADMNWWYIDIFNVAQGTYSLKGWVDTAYSVAGYDDDGVFVQGFPPASSGSQTYTFTIDNHQITKLRISTHNSGKTAFEFKKTDITVDRKSLISELDIVSDPIPTIWVSKSGGDSNSGTISKPFLTINRAIEEIASTGGKIVVKEGDYYETLNLDILVKGNVLIQSFGFDKVRIMGSNEITGITKTGGRTLIYEAPFTETLELIGNDSEYGYRIFEDNFESKLIPLSERNALQRSQNYRLPYTEIKRIEDQGSLSNNLSYLDALSDGESGFWNDGTKIYIVNTSHSDVSASSIHYPIRENTNTTVSDSSNERYDVDIEIRDIDFYYSSEIGLNLYRFGKVKLWHVSVFGARLTGINEQNSHSELNMVEAANCGTDGIASALYFTVPNLVRNKEKWNSYKDIWCHDNYDDGFSIHQNGASTIDGFLFEYNRDTGLQNIGSSYSFVKNGVSRGNTKGVVINGGASSTHSRTSTSLEGYNIIAEDNRWNYESQATESTGNSVMNLYNCVSRGATEIGYRVNGEGSVGIANNCSSSDDVVDNSGFTVVNDGSLTP